MSDVNYNKFKDSLLRLEERYNFYLKQKDILTEIQILESIKESCIQRFEVCFDMTWKHLKKYLEKELGLPDVPSSPKPIFKLSFSNKLINEVELWITFNDIRTDTSHDYSATKADVSLQNIEIFIREAIELYQKISGTQWNK